MSLLVYHEIEEEGVVFMDKGNTSIKQVDIAEPVYYNRACAGITSVLGVALAVSSFLHGFYEFMQGNNATEGLIIQAIGPEQRHWVHGTEEAFTIIPNFLITGMVTMLLSILTAIWSAKFIHSKYGSRFFLMIFIALTFLGGGIAHVVFFLPVWGYSTRIMKELKFWRKIFKTGVTFGKKWPVAATVTVTTFLIALLVSVFGYVPSIKDPDTKLYICWSILGVSFIMLHITYVIGFAYDVNRNNIVQ